MANNKIQIKRSITTAITNTTPSVSNGELVFTSNGYVLAIGDPANSANVISIGGARYPGVLTANQALVANSTSGIDKIITANLTLSSFSVSTINAVANLTHLGAASNSELTTTWAIKSYVDLKSAAASNPQGANGQFQYNDSGVLAGTTNMTYDKVNTLVTIGNSTINVTFGSVAAANQIAKFAGNQNTYLQVIHQNANTGNNSSADYVLYNDTGVTGNGEVNLLDLGYNSSTYNDPAYNITDAGGGYLYTANGSLAIGTKEAVSGAVLKFFTGGTTAGQERVRIDNSGNVGIGNTAPNAKLQVTGTANISGLTTISANLVLGAALSANGSTGTAGFALKSGGTGNVYWEAVSAGVAGSDTQVQFNDGGSLAGDAGMTFNKTTDTLTLAGAVNVGANAITNTSAVFVGNSTVNAVHTSALLQVSNSTAISNLTAFGLAAGANVVANTTTLKVGNTTLTTTNAVFGGTIAANGGVGTAGQVLLSAGAANAYWSNSLGVFQFTDLTVSGNLTVLGDLVSLNVATLAVEDPLIVLAKDQSNTASYTDAVDIGFFGSYGNTLTKNWAGLFRDQSDSGIFKLFNGNIPEPTSTVDTANVNFAYATLQSYIRTGGAGAAGMIANATHIAITANSTLNVAITANTLSLTTALPTTSGGTGLNSYAAGDLLVGNTGNVLTRLASGVDGYVLQINGTGVVAWNTLDGGTF